MASKDLYMWELGVSSGGRHFMDMMPLLPRNHQGRHVTVGLNGAAVCVVDLGRKRLNQSQV